MNKAKPPCKYGAKCYRKNLEHRKQFSHGPEDDEVATDSDEADAKVKKERKSHQRNEAKTEVDTSSKPVVVEEEKDDSKTQKRRRVDQYFTKTNPSKTDSGETPASKQPKVVPDEEVSADEPSTSTANKNTLEIPTATTSNQLTEDEASSSSLSPQDEIKQKFLVDMPEDFFKFWEFASSINGKNPCEAFASSLGLRLVGPYDVMAGRTRNSSKDKDQKPNYLLHWRYYYDPPEFLTIIRGDDKTQFHMGYFRDDPKALPVFVAYNKAAEDCSLKPCGENLFAAVSWFIGEKLKSEKSKSLSDLQAKLKQWATEGGFSLEQRTSRMKEREKKVVSKSFHGAGIVVPVDKNGVGYRPLPETPGALRKILKQIVEGKTQEERDRSNDALAEIVTLVQFANDECDYGEGLELGIDVFCFGGEQLHGIVLALLPLAYKLLKRPEFAQIITAHLQSRTRSPVTALNVLA